ncbi:MAG: alcohol dehydrogenase catalytic domain-containing protein, partial [Candidatus Acidiferrum sp.]
LVERPMPEPSPREVRLKVEACGICHSDVFAVTGAFPGVRYPTVPGHEVAGRIDKLGLEVTTWQVGQRVGVGCGSAGYASCATAVGAVISSPAAILECWHSL